MAGGGVVPVPMLSVPIAGVEVAMLSVPIAMAPVQNPSPVAVRFCYWLCASASRRRMREPVVHWPAPP